MGTYRLIAHPDHPPAKVQGVQVQWLGMGVDGFRLRYRVDGHEQLVVPAFAGKGRADELWRTTCFELYLQPPGTNGYVELNFSPSQRWAAYEFEDYRAGMRDLPMGHEPVCESTQGKRFFVLDVRLSPVGLPDGPWQAGFSAIIEETDGTKSYWALAHAPGKPDFHHPTCWALELAAPGAA